MPPIASIPAAFAFATTTPSVALVPDSAGQSAPTLSQYWAGPGGAVFAAVAIVSVAGYLYHGRGTASKAGKSSTWATLSSFLSAVRRRGSGATTATAGSGWPPDIEGGLEDVSMVYARFFHPTFWNLVECHPATPSAPAICVEDEADEIPASEPTPYGMNSFLDMGDEDGDGDGTACTGPNPEPRIPPYDTHSATHVRFKSVIIGATDRPGGGFLCVPGRHQDGGSCTSSCGQASMSSVDVCCSPYDGILAESEVDVACPSRDGTSVGTPNGIFGTQTDFGADSGLAYLNDSQRCACSPNDGIQTTPARSSPSTRRYGMADMAGLAQSLKCTIPEERSGLGLVRTMGCRRGLCNLSDFNGTNPEEVLTWIEPRNDRPTGSSCDMCDDRDDFRDGWSNGGAFTPPHEGPDLMRQILEELRDPNMDCTPRDLSEDSDFEYDADNTLDDDEGSISRPAPTWSLDRQGRISLEWTSSAPITESDLSDGGSICPLTPPLRSATVAPSLPRVNKAGVSPPAIFWFDEEAQVVVPTCSGSPLWLPSRSYFRPYRPRRALPMVPGPAWSPY